MIAASDGQAGASKSSQTREAGDAKHVSGGTVVCWAKDFNIGHSGNKCRRNPWTREHFPERSWQATSNQLHLFVVPI